MLDRSLVEARPSKRPHSNDEGNDVLPSKTITTPRTRSQAETTPKHVPISAQRLTRSRGTGPVMRTPVQTPKTQRDAHSVKGTLCFSETRTKRTRSKSPGNGECLTTSTRSMSKTPSSDVKVQRGRRSKSNSPVVKRTNRTPFSATKSTRRSPRITKINAEDVTENEKPLRTPRLRNGKSPKLNDASKAPNSLRTSRSQNLEHSPKVDLQNIQEKLATRLTEVPHILVNDVGDKISTDGVCKSESGKQIEKEIKEGLVSSDKDEDFTCDKIKEETVNVLSFEKDVNPYDRPSSVSDMEDLSSQLQSKIGEQSPTEGSAPECTEEVKKEIEKVKKRRSTIGRGRKSGQSYGGRRSIITGLPMLSLEDQISNIDKDLPKTSKVSHLLDISLREAMRRLEDQFKTEECISDLRSSLITNSEKIGGHVAYKIAGLPLEVEDSAAKKINAFVYSSDKAGVLKNKTKKLEQEYKCWKSLLKERKNALKSADREFREARSGETKIEDDNMKNLTGVQRSILAAKPNYNQYIKEVQMAREKTLFYMQEINHTTCVINNFITASKAVADSCFSALEKMTFGTTRDQEVKSALNTLLTLEEGLVL